MPHSLLDLDALRAAPLVREPFEYLILPGFVAAEDCAAINADYPAIDKHGSFPIEHLPSGPAFNRLIDALRGPDFRQICEQKFHLDLGDRPTVITARGQCCAKDGRIHTDTASKIITVLLYMNAAWEPSGGRLRLLRTGDNLDDYIAEVPPHEGTLLLFRRSESSWHGHKQFVGPRRVIQFNWVTDDARARWHVWKHRVSATVKKLVPFA
ncbi:MAG: 2OG-Fe(II) oxygenase [Pirellulales bacterium]